MRRSTFIKYFIAALLVAAICCETFVYIVQPLFWPTLKCRQDELCTKILFVADPQIQGELAAPSPLNHIFIYDSDVYLKRTFSVVASHFLPDVVVYLGDIMDEGSVATEEQYQRYANRIKNIFDSYDEVVNVWVPGDNDIGGEMEPIRKDKIEAFAQEFQGPSVITWKNISYYKVNAITHNYPKLEDNSTDIYKMVISHYPVTLNYIMRNKVVDELHPDIFFCAHSHESKYVQMAKDFSSRKTYQLPGRELEERNSLCNIHGRICPGKDILQVLLNDEFMYEVYVPTCSYRMGTSKIGYGAAVFEHKDRTIQYTVFWSPQRFPYLIFYLVILIIVIMYCGVYCAARFYKRRWTLNRSSVAGKDSIPLLQKMRSTLSHDNLKTY